MNRLFNWSWMRKVWKKKENHEETPNTRLDHKSLISSIEKLKIDSSTNEAPINRLPNELIQVILIKLELDSDVQKLAQLRLVSTRWRAVVEDYFAQKKSFIVAIDQKAEFNLILDQFNSPKVEKRFFGFANFKDFSILYLSTKTLSKYLRSLLNLFPNIVQLSIRCHDDSEIDDLITYINSLDSLTQHDLDGLFVSLTLPKLSTTLSKLKHFSFEIESHLNDDQHGSNDDQHHQLVSQLGPSCVRVYFGVPFDQIRQWHNINPHWLANLTHLRIYVCKGQIFDGEVYAQVIHYLSEQATLLEHLSIDTLSFLSVELKLSVIGDLTKLTHLTSLEIHNFVIVFSELEKAASQQRLPVLSSVLTLKLDSYFYVLRPFDADAFTRLLSVIFPNLVNLYLYIGAKWPEIYQRFLDELEQRLDRFPNLRKHEIKV